VDSLTAAEQGVCKLSGSYGRAKVTLSTSLKATAYLLDSEPPKRSQRTTIQKTSSGYIYGNNDEYFGFVLVKGSTVEYNITSDRSVRFLVLTPDNYDKFSRDSSYDYEYSSYGLSFKSSWTNYDKDQPYYFVIYNSVYSSTYVKWGFAVHYSSYDVSGYTDKCTWSRCEFSTKSNSWVIVEMPADAYGTVNVEMTKEFNGSIKGLVIAIIISVPIFIITVVIACVRRRNRRLREAATAPLIGSAPVVVAPVVVAPPPVTPVGGSYAVPPPPPPAYPGALPPAYPLGAGPDGVPLPPPQQQQVPPPVPSYLFPGGVPPVDQPTAPPPPM